MLPAEHGFEGLIANTPMRRLQRLVGRDDIEIYAKLEGTNLGGSVKDRAALAMITTAHEAGLLTGKRIVEATSGNTGIALAMIAALMELPITLTMPETATPERRAIMKAYGAEVLLTDGIEAAIDLAHELHNQGTHHMLDQFSNPANPEMHYRTTGPEIWGDTGGRITHFVASMGTTGTMMGTGRYLKEVHPGIELVGVHPAEGHKIPGSRKWPPAYEPSIYDATRVDRIIHVTRPVAEDHVRALCRKEAIFAGISSGGAAWGALEVAKTAPAGSVIVFIVCDRGDKYLSVEGLFPR
jgi:cysteine synthase B